jgi:putative NADPH-quinone reductase
MARRRILITDGHPDADAARFVHALASAYAEGGAGHDIQTVRIADLDFPVLRDPKDWMEQPAPASIAAAQKQIEWAEHLVILYPLWLGDMPALLKAFLEQVLRPGFAFRYGSGMMADKLLTGRSARVIVTMGMPRAVYELFFLAHSVRSFERNILKFVGVSPVRRTIIGSVEASDKHRRRWLETVAALGAAGA